ncbi:MAG TPA: hypothetical protein DIT65_07600 [Cryomorphaceae bacterium]|nr:hypothetical protein [Cryomorphaceae bacterium]|tara:strand:+ start:621 stop:1040 length:420 start_codon:yes stop_codon:yes gene_type:complete
MMRALFVLFLFLLGTFTFGQSHTIEMCFSDASQYPTRVAYEVQNDKGIILKQGFLEVVSASEYCEVLLAVSKKFAVLVYEDANRNSQMDRGWFAQPLEKYAFSNNAWATLSKPDLEDMLISRTGAKTRVTLTFKSVTDF